MLQARSGGPGRTSLAVVLRSTVARLTGAAAICSVVVALAPGVASAAGPLAAGPSAAGPLAAGPLAAGPVQVGGSNAVVMPTAGERGVASPHSPAGPLGSGVGASGIAACNSVPSKPSAECDVTYHGGPVMVTNITHIVYWAPPGYAYPSGYQGLVERYLADVAHDSGSSKNSNSVATQYYQTTGGTNQPIRYESTYGGAVTATNSFPSGACQASVPACLSQSQEQLELDGVINTIGGQRGTGNLWFLVLPPGVQTCFDDGSGCGPYTAGTSGNRYCAYHSSFTYLEGALIPPATIWANMPYDTEPGCENSQVPNNNDADDEINTMSHEMNEAITDPEPTSGWIDDNTTNGGEVGDQCNFHFGPSIGKTSTGNYDEKINGDPYNVQEQWSNAAPGCVINMAHGTSTKVSCAGSSVPAGGLVPCLVVVKDTSKNSATPTGTVSFALSPSSGSVDVTQCTLFAVDGQPGEASCPFPVVTATDAVKYTLTAGYGGDSEHIPSKGTATVTGTKHVTSTSVTCSPAFVTIGDPSTCTAVVTGAIGLVPVKYSSSGATFTAESCSLTESGETCTAAFASSAVATHTITALYPGDGNDKSSTGTTKIAVIKHVTSTTVTCSPSIVTIGNPSTCTATVTGSTTLVDVKYSSGGAKITAELCAGTPSGEQCAARLAWSAVGTHTVSGLFPGDAADASSTGTAKVTVDKVLP